jgi:carboxypeptidase Q
MNRNPVRTWYLALALVLLAVVQTAAQDRVDLQAAELIRREGLESGSKVWDYLSWLSDVYGPRLAESPQYRKAAEWAVTKLTEMGLVNAKMESYGDHGLVRVQRGYARRKAASEVLDPNEVQNRLPF